MQRSLKHMAVTVVVVLVVLAFIGVEPLAIYKDNIVDKATTIMQREIGKWNTYQSEAPMRAAVAKKRRVDDYVEMFNDYRVERGLHPLRFTSQLNAIAEVRVEEIKTEFSHAGIRKYNLGENIFEGVYSNKSALDGWHKSPGHRVNMQIGYSYSGYAASGGYAVQVFSY